MKRPAKVTRETRPSQYARKLYGKKKEEQYLKWEESDPASAPSRRGVKKKIRTQMNRRLRRRQTDIPSGGAYRKELDMDEQ